ncbi:MAG: putative hydro-lyase [Gemmataceae bacterium]|nr:putative hydro-lyase [Gemmataceae bacterium]
MTEPLLTRIRDIVQEDVCNRGLRTDPSANLVSATADDFAAACRSIAQTENAVLGIVTGFYIPHAHPPCGETDGPLGAVFLARALAPLGIRVVLLTDGFCVAALEAGVAMAGLRKSVPIVKLPAATEFESLSPETYWETVSERMGSLTHLIALERVGPSHTPESLQAHPDATAEDRTQFCQAVTPEHFDRCHTMRGRDITSNMSPAHLLFEASARQAARIVTIGIGDGGNEIGMGKLPWRMIRNNIPGGGIVACRVPTDHLIVCGISNWGAYALAAGVRLLRGQAPKDLFDPHQELKLLEWMVQRGPLVDGVSGEETATVDGLTFEKYAVPLQKIAAVGVESREPTGVESRESRAQSQCSDAGLRSATGAEVRRRARSGELQGMTAGMAMGYVQANLVVLPRELAFDFLLFCQRNPKPCPLLDVTEPGSAEPRLVAAGADLRTDLPRYRIYRDGVLVEEPTDLNSVWREDLVAFVIGCSYTFENALQQAGLPVRHIEAGCNVPMYRTNIACRPAGVFRGPTVVSMRPMTPAQAIAATRICGRFPRAHGAPLHIGDPAAIGIRDIDRPDFGDAVPVRPGEVPVFWACGVTPQAVAMEVRPSFMLAHMPGHMFLTDLRDADLEGE